VFIGGGNVQFNPGTGNSVVIGNPTNPSTWAYATLGSDNNAMLRVYDSGINSNGIITSFKTRNQNALIEVTSALTNQSLLFGVLNTNKPEYAGASFAFMDANLKPYLTFTSSASVQQNYVGVGITKDQIPTAQMHIYTNGDGANMLRLTKAVYTHDTNDDAPQIDLQKNYQLPGSDALGSTSWRQAPTTWTMKGGMGSWYQKLAFIYSQATNPGNQNSTAITSTEVLCITSNACVGIGTSQPSFALDVLNANNVGALRIRNTGDASPHIVFQSGNELYGSDSQRD
jgi:hypothetical protein